jgi:TetR/AcrR family transcriptional regulator, transcriptional repressor for nem operon
MVLVRVGRAGEPMGRIPTFDREAALSAALQTFWERGYGASSVQLLLDAMELNRGSLYNSFGDKEQLFREALDLYFERITKVVVQLLEASPDPVQGIVAVFELTLVQLPVHLQRRGCLLVNTAAELSETDPTLARHAFSLLQRVRAGFVTALQRARQTGQWRDRSADAEVAADVLFNFLTGLRVTARLSADPAQLRASVQHLIVLLGLEVRVSRT